MLVEFENINFIDIMILFLDVIDEELVFCYKEIWCVYLMVMDGLVIEGICKECVMLEEIKVDV